MNDSLYNESANVYNLLFWCLASLLSCTGFQSWEVLFFLCDLYFMSLVSLKTYREQLSLRSKLKTFYSCIALKKYFIPTSKQLVKCLELLGLVASLTRNYVQRKRRFRKAGSSSTFSILRRELREGTLQSHFSGSSFVASSNFEPDPLLSSFIYNPAAADESVSAQPSPSVETNLVKESSKDNLLERWELFVYLSFALFEKWKKKV